MNKLSRRAFARTTALAAAATVATLPQAVAQPAEPAPQPEVEARLAWIFGKYGSRLNEQQRADIRRNLTGAMSAIEQMRAYPLDNAVEPDTVFKVWRGGK